MNKKIFVIMLVAIFLIASIGFVSAKDISVSINWDDNGNAANRPAEVSVSLIHDGKVVDTEKLSASNAWKTTFKNQEADSGYSVKVKDISGYDVSTKENSGNEFIITGKLIEEPVLSASDDNEDDTLAEEVNEIVGDDNTGQPSDEPTNNGGENSQNEEPATNEGGQPADNGEQKTNETNTTDNNSTTNEPDTPTSDSTAPEDKKVTKKPAAKKTTTKTTKTTKTVVKKEKPVKKNNTTKMKKAGLPIALVLIAMGAIFIPIARKKE